MQQTSVQDLATFCITIWWQLVTHNPDEPESEVPLLVSQMGKCVRHSSQRTVQYNKRQ